MEKNNRPSIGAELRALVSFRQTGKEKNTWNESDDTVAQHIYEKLLDQGRFFDSTVQPERVGRGWHNMVYRIGNYVMKIPYGNGPVAGFSYTPTQEGASVAQDHLDSLRCKAKHYGLDDLIGNDEQVFFVQGTDDHTIPDAIVNVQKYYNTLIGTKNAAALQFSIVEKKQLLEELKQFSLMFRDLRRNNGLRIDLFGSANLAISKNELGKLHFVLSDTQPSDHQFAGVITEFGLSASFIKEMLTWKSILRIPRNSRRISH